MRPLRSSPAVVVTVLLAALAGTGVAEDAAQRSLERGFYQKEHGGDLELAVAAFEQVVSDQAAPDELRSEAGRMAAECREDLAAADFARLMPPDALAYVEIVEPGKHVARVASMLGLLATTNGSQPAAKPGATPLGDGLFLPHDIAISPALVAELGKIQGVAAAVTSIDPRQGPYGVAVLHPGDSDLVRGLMETGIQFFEPIEPIGGFKSYRIEGQVWLTATRRLLIFSRSREQNAAAVARLKDANEDSLAAQEHFRRLRGDRREALLFAYVDGRRAVEMWQGALGGDEARIANAIFDLNHVQGISAVLRSTADRLEMQTRLMVGEGNNNLAYGLVRTAPISGRTLKHVPRGAAAVAVVGLNRADDVVIDDAPRHSQYVRGMDIGAEIFSNVEEVCLFVSDPSSLKRQRVPIPDAALVLAVKDAAKSEALWNQLLALPAAFGGPAIGPPEETQVDGRPATQYRFPPLPPIQVVRVEERALIAGTPGAVAAAVAAGAGGQALADDPRLTPALDRMGWDSSKAVLVHVGRALRMAARMERGRDAEAMRQVGSMLDDLTVFVVTDETPTELTIRAEVTGLPDLPRIVRAMWSAEPQVAQSEN